MKVCRTLARKRKRASRHAVGYRPHLEALEKRLPPGSLLGTTLFSNIIDNEIRQARKIAEQSLNPALNYARREPVAESTPRPLLTSAETTKAIRGHDSSTASEREIDDHAVPEVFALGVDSAMILEGLPPQRFRHAPMPESHFDAAHSGPAASVNYSDCYSERSKSQSDAANSRRKGNAFTDAASSPSPPHRLSFLPNAETGRPLSEGETVPSASAFATTRANPLPPIFFTVSGTVGEEDYPGFYDDTPYGTPPCATASWHMQHNATNGLLKPGGSYAKSYGSAGPAELTSNHELYFNWIGGGSFDWPAVNNWHDIVAWVKGPVGTPFTYEYTAKGVMDNIQTNPYESYPLEQYFTNTERWAGSGKKPFNYNFTYSGVTGGNSTIYCGDTPYTPAHWNYVGYTTFKTYAYIYNLGGDDPVYEARQTVTSKLHVQINQGVPPEAIIDGPGNVAVGVTATFTSKSFDPDNGSHEPGSGILAYEWDDGNGGQQTGSSAHFKWDEPGRYTVSLTVTDDEGMTDSAEKIVEVIGEPDWTISLDGFTNVIPPELRRPERPIDTGGWWADNLEARTNLLIVNSSQVNAPSTTVDISIVDGNSARRMRSVAVPQLGPAQSVLIPLSLFLPSNIDYRFAGPASLQAEVDPRHIVKELDEQNNTSAMDVVLVDPRPTRNLVDETFATEGEAENYLLDHGFVRAIFTGGWERIVYQHITSRYDGGTKVTGAFRQHANAFQFPGQTVWRVWIQGTETFGEPRPAGSHFWLDLLYVPNWHATY